VNLKLKQLYLNRVEDDEFNDEKFSLSEPRTKPGPGRGVDLLTVAFVLVLVGIVLWVVVGPMINPCLGVTEGGRIQDPDHPDRVLVCKR